MAKGTWFAIELTFNHKGETKLFRFMNCSAAKVKEMRFTILQEGLQLPMSADTYIVIFPWFVTDFVIIRQKNFFYDQVSDLQRTVFTPEQTVKQKA